MANLLESAMLGLGLALIIAIIAAGVCFPIVLLYGSNQAVIITFAAFLQSLGFLRDILNETNNVR